MTLRGFEGCETPEDERDRLREEVGQLREQVAEARKLLNYLTQFEAPHAMLFKNDYDQMRMEARMWLRANPEPGTDGEEKP